MLKNFTEEELKIAWKVLDALQGNLQFNVSLNTEDVFKRFDFIENLKTEIDVRSTEEKLSSESLLSYMEAETNNASSKDLHKFKNNLYSIFRKYK